MYLAILEATESDRELYLAVPSRVQEGILDEEFGEYILRRLGIRILVFDENAARIIQWKK